MSAFVNCQKFILFTRKGKAKISSRKRSKRNNYKRKEKEEYKLVPKYLDVTKKLSFKDVDKQSFISSETSIEGMVLNHEESINRDVLYIMVKKNIRQYSGKGNFIHYKKQ